MASPIITEIMKQELIKLTPEDLTISNITKLFGYTTKKENGKFVTVEPKFKTTSKIHLKANEYINTTEIDTNVGILLFNKLLIEGKLNHVIPGGYYNEVLDKKKIGKLMDILSDALMKKQIMVNPTLVQFLKDYEFYGLKLTALFCPSYSWNMIKLNPKLMKEKENALKNSNLNDVATMTKLEDKLVSDAKEILKNDPAMTLFNSGARGSFDNDYKNMSLAVGPSLNPSTNKFDFIKSNFTEGLKKTDLVAAGNIIVTSSYPKAVGTQVGGYMSKIFYSLFQSIVVDKPGTDCGTNVCTDIFLTEDIVNLFLYQNIRLQSGQLVTLTSDNYKQFLNKKVHFRTPEFCLTDKICSVCAGKRLEILDLENIGLTTPRISNGLMNLRMKTKHVTKITFDEVDIDKLLL